MTSGRTESASADRVIDALLSAVGGNHEPRADIMDDVRGAVYAEWQRLIHQRRRHRRMRSWSVAASLALTAVATGLLTRAVATPPTPVASITNIDGNLISSARDAGKIKRAMGQSISVGDELQTDLNSRAALTFPSGLSLRLDHATRLKFSDIDQVVLTTGAIYIDAPPDADAPSRLTVETPTGSVQHLGTQYEVRSDAEGMAVSVREGRVKVTHAQRTNIGETGQVLRVNADGSWSREELSPTASQWRWAFQAGPTFPIEDQSLAQFLQWLARETGRQLKYLSPQAEAAAAAVQLRGSIEGLDPDSALSAVLSTTQLRRRSTTDAELAIELSPVDFSKQERLTPNAGSLCSRA